MLAFYIKYHAKFFAALSAPVALLSKALADGVVRPGEAKDIGYAFVAPLLVYVFPNADPSTKPPTKASLQAQIDALSAQIRQSGGTPGV